MGDEYSLVHAYILWISLCNDLSTLTGAAKHGLKWRQTPELEALRHTYNLLLSVNTDKNAKREFYPSPFPDVTSVTRTGGDISRDEAREIFRKMNPNLEGNKDA
jgi:hypothetical protein